jgi:hypothetical protein
MGPIVCEVDDKYKRIGFYMERIWAHQQKGSCQGNWAREEKVRDASLNQSKAHNQLEDVAPQLS